MKVDIKKTVPFFGVDQRLALCPRLLLNYFQEAAGIHVELANEDTLALMKKGRAWVLSRIGLAVQRWPRLGDQLNITTWHTGDKGFKAFRDFEVRCNDEVLISATSMWLFIDLNQKKILRIPKDTSDAYTKETPLPLNLDLDTWTPATKFTPDQVYTMSIRPSDYDPLGHVNNALYFDFLGNLIARALPGAPSPEQIRLQYVKEIPLGTETIQMGLSQDKGAHLFKFYSGASVHAAGAFTLGEPMPEESESLPWIEGCLK